MKKLTVQEKAEMYKEIDSLSVENLHVLAENDPIIGEKETEESITNVLGLNSDMQSYTNSLEVQPMITLGGDGVPDISEYQKKARINAETWRTEINPEVSKNYTDLKSFLNFVSVLSENDIETIVDDAVNSVNGQENFNALIQEFSNDADKYNINAMAVANQLTNFNTLLNTDYHNFLTAYEMIERIYNDTDGKRAQLRKKIEELLGLIQGYNVGIGIASAAIALCVLASILAAVLSVVTAGTTSVIIGGAVAVTTAMVGALPELVKKRDECQVQYNSANSELAFLNRQCALANALKNNLNSMLNFNGKITPQVGFLSRNWATIGKNYKNIKETTEAGLDANKALILKLRLKAALKTSLSLTPIAKQCEINQLLPVKVSKNLVIDLNLPSVWANKAIDSNTFFNYIHIRRKNS